MGSDVSFRWLDWPGRRAAGVVSAVSYGGPGFAHAVKHRGMPSPWLTFVISMADPVTVRGLAPRAGEAWPAGPALRADVCVAGLGDRAAAVEMHGPQDGVQLGLDPLAARRLLGVPAVELPTVGVDALDVIGPGLQRLRERLAEAPPGRRAAVVGTWVHRRIGASRVPPVRAEVGAAWRLLVGSGGRMRVRDVAERVQLSERQLRIVMRRELGVAPKTAARLARFDGAVARLVAGRDASVAEVASVCGYADHSHLDHEFVAMVGCSPGQWLAEERRNIQDGGHRNRPDSVS